MNQRHGLAVALLMVVAQGAAASEGKVLVDQVGYDTGSIKQAIVTGDAGSSAQAFRVVNADTGVHPDLLNSRFGYVSISRASHEAMVFTNDAAKLGQQLESEITKTSALGMGQPMPTAPGFDIGIGL